MTRAEVAIAEAARLRALGYNPIPCNNRIGHCPEAHAAEKASGFPADRFERLARRGCHGLQVCCGEPWGLAVLDVDGEIASALLAGWCVYQPFPATPTVLSPRGGMHYWFRHDGPIKSGHVWKMPGGHNGIEILGDRSLARTPPSYKLIDGREVPYRWLPGRSLDDLPPAEMPRWIADMPRVAPAGSGVPIGVPGIFANPMRFGSLKGPEKPGQRGDAGRSTCSATSRGGDWKAVRDAISDKVSLAERFGLRVVSRTASPDGWITCRSIFREDRHPSARFNSRDGRYWEAGMGPPISLFYLLVALRAFPDFPSAVKAIERRAS